MAMKSIISLITDKLENYIYSWGLFDRASSSWNILKY